MSAKGSKQNPQRAKRTPPLSISSAMSRLAKMVELIERELRIAIQLEISLETANIIVKSHLHGHQFFGAECYDTLKLATQLHLATTLAKLFESPRGRGGRETDARRANRSDIASIPLMLRLLAQKRCRTKLSAAALSWLPFRSSMDDSNAAAVESNALAAWSRYRELKTSKAGLAALKKLNLFRNEWLAHVLMMQSEVNIPKYEQLFLLVDAATDIVSASKFAIEGRNLDLRDWRKERVRIIGSFLETRPCSGARLEKFILVP